MGLLFAYGDNRNEVLKLIRKMILDFWVVGNIQTNQRFLIELLHHPWVEEEIFYAGFIDDEYVPNLYFPEIAKKLFYSTIQYLPEISENSNDSGWYLGKQRLKVEPTSQSSPKWLQGPVFWKHENRTALEGVIQAAQDSDENYRVSLFPSGDHWLVRVGIWFTPLRRIPLPYDRQSLALKALCSGRIHAVLFLEGTSVSAHEPLITLEAFGVLIPHALPVELKIKQWLIKAEDIVLEGQVLAHLQGL
jgi:acetyl/propionyl-CoA carboxylase alpha subunit